jgi:serine/threonine-protein kinase/endoribonuclease IRE1
MTSQLRSSFFVVRSVAVFDLVRSSQRAQPFALLQPRARLEEMFPRVDFLTAAKAKQLNPQATFVGLVGDSLFAMSPERYPLVMFEDAGRGHRRPTIDAPHAQWEQMTEVDKLTEHRKWKKLCGDGTSMDPRCLTGVRSLELTGQSRLRRLLEGPDAIPESTTPDPVGTRLSEVAGGGHIVDAITNASASVTQGVLSTAATASTLLTLAGPVSSVQLAYGISISLFTLVIFLLFALKRSQISPASPQRIHNAFSQVNSSPKSSANILGNGGSHIPHAFVEKPNVEELKTPTTKSSAISFQLPDPTDSPTEGRDGDESDKENGDAPATPGKRRPTRRGRRGKKKKGAVGTGGVGGEEGENGDEAGAKDGDEGSANGSAEGPPPATLVVMPPTPVMAPMQSLVVSDEILGKKAVFLILMPELTPSRFWLSRNRGLPRVTPRTCCCCQETASRLRNPCLA